MNHPHHRALVVLARIPDVNNGSKGKQPCASTPLDVGRLLGQAVSFRVLAGVALLLLITAVVPLSSRKNAPVPESMCDAAVAIPAAETAAAPNPVLPAPPSQTLSAPTATCTSVAASDAQQPQMTPWRAPECDASGITHSGGDAAPPVVQSPIYQADSRAGRPLTASVGASLQQPIEQK